MRNRLLDALVCPRDARELARIVRAPVWRVVEVLVTLEREGVVKRVPMGWGVWLWKLRK